MSPHRRSWPYLSTPLSIYLAVMLPVCALEVFLIVSNSPAWMRWSAGAVVAFSILGFLRGYVRRLVLDEHGARLAGVLRPIEIDWSDVRHTGVYTPGGAVGVARYVFITRRDEPPAGPWDIDADTIQVQYHDGLLEAIEAARARVRPAGGSDFRPPPMAS